MPPYRWRPDTAPTHELRRIARAQLGSGLEELDDDDRHVAVHAIRRRGKELRALLRLVRRAAPALCTRENAAIRDATRRVSADRDAAAALETYDTLVDGFGDAVDTSALEPLRTGLLERRDAVLGGELEHRLAAVREDLRATLERVDRWQVDGEGFAVVAGGLGKTYGRARDRMEDAYEQGSPEAFHLWRKRSKDHRYHLQLLQDVWPEIMGAQMGQLHALTDLLGDDHDLAVLREDLLAEPERYGGEAPVSAVCALVDRRRTELQAEARMLGRRCFAEPPDRFVERIGAYWRTAEAPAGTGPLTDGRTG